jgi:glucokinase
MKKKFIHSQQENLAIHSEYGSSLLSINHNRPRLKSRGSRRLIISIDLGGTNLKAALLDLKYRILDRKVLSTQSFDHKESLIKAIIDCVNLIAKKHNLPPAAILGLGLGLPGPIDYRRGVVHFFPNISGWKEINLKLILEKKTRLPVFLDNDANLMSLAEHRLGAAKGFANAICLTLGTGVGAGVILGDRLYRGQDNAAGEVGHIPINENGPTCNCGGVACLEAYIGNNRILKKAQRLFKRKISLEELSLLAKKGDRKAKSIWMNAARRLGIALSAVVNLLNPDIIVLGGGVANAGEVLFDGVRKAINSRSMSVQAKRVKVVKAGLGSDAGLIGAAILVKEGSQDEDIH